MQTGVGQSKPLIGSDATANKEYERTCTRARAETKKNKHAGAMVRSPIRLSSPFMRYAARLLDLLLIWLCAELIYLLQFGTGLAMQYALVMTVATLIWVLTGGSVYRSWRFNKLGNLLGSVISAWLLVVLAVVLWLFLSKSSSSISRLWFVSWAAGTLAAMCLVRVFVFAVLHVLRKVGYNYKTVLLVGASPACGLVQKLLSESGWTGLQVQAEVTTDALAAFLAVPGQKPSNEVWLCLSLADQGGVENALYALRHSTANIRLVPDWYSLKLINHGISHFGLAHHGCHPADQGGPGPGWGASYLVGDCSANGGDCLVDQVHIKRAGAFQAVAPRLERRAHSGLQISHHGGA